MDEMLSADGGYIDVFVLPALVANPPPPRAAFGD
jgi:hypothetical protein